MEEKKDVLKPIYALRMKEKRIYLEDVIVKEGRAVDVTLTNHREFAKRYKSKSFIQKLSQKLKDMEVVVIDEG